MLARKGVGVMGDSDALLANAREQLYAVGVSIKRDRCLGVVVDVDGSVVGFLDEDGEPVRAVAQLPLADTSAATVVARVADLVQELLGRHLDMADPLGLGVELSGHVDARRGSVDWSHRMGWDRPVPLARLLSEATGYPSAIEHDVKALALGEQMFGLGRDVSTFAVVTVGVGIGCGLILDNQLVRGKTGIAGELGHLVLNPDGSVCACGKRGCLETVAGTDGIVRALRHAGRPEVVDIDTAARLAGDDPAARAAFERAGRALGQGLSWLVNLLNPELLILRCQPAVVEADGYVREARRVLEAGAFSSAASDCRMVVLERSIELGARSAGSMVFEGVSGFLRLTGERD
jgi:predicted NBD/HSP70 family sugar kinase